MEEGEFVLTRDSVGAIKYFHRMKNAIFAEADTYCNGKVYEEPVILKEQSIKLIFPSYEKNCEICHKEFSPDKCHPHQRFCANCRHENYLRALKKWREKHPDSHKQSKVSLLV